MKQTVTIAGFGGQGVLLAGMILAQSALEENKQTTFFPTYGAEMRGGTANSAVIISDDPIGSPVVSNPDFFISLNEQSLNKFLPTLENCSVILNSSLVKSIPSKKGIKFFPVPCSEIAEKEAGNVRSANMVALGFYSKVSATIDLRCLKTACEKAFSGNDKLIKLNYKALESGYNYQEKLK
jgi:2-oxoglutarate ferredoxin oxidoreductase subunit gamma